MALPPLFPHQIAASDLWIKQRLLLNFSDPGTGKTRATLDAIARRGRSISGKTLVLAPLSILEPAWGQDIKKWTPHLTYTVAYARNREKAFETSSDIIITNHDAIKWIAKKLSDNPKFLDQFDTLVVDESTAFKNPQSQRTKAIMALAKHFTYRLILTGTPNPNTIANLWSQVFIVDLGERLGDRYWQWLPTVCTGEQIAGAPVGARKWVDKHDAEEQTAMALADITYRAKRDECKMPLRTFNTMLIDLPPALRKQYNQLMHDAVLLFDTGAMTAQHAGVKLKKALQLLTGAVYDNEKEVKIIHTSRYELVLDLIGETQHSLVAFNWRHEREQLTALAEKLGITYGVIDGSVPVKKRVELCTAYQNGEIQVIFAHPQSAGHGLTLTRGTRIIWASPTYNAEFYEQFNARIYRTGQELPTDVIRIAAINTAEEKVYELLDGKTTHMQLLLGLTQMN